PTSCGDRSHCVLEQKYSNSDAFVIADLQHDGCANTLQRIPHDPFERAQMSSGRSSFDSENQNTFRNAAVAQHYVSMTSLFPPEARALDKIRSLVKAQPILDIGVGSGR